MRFQYNTIELNIKSELISGLYVLRGKTIERESYKIICITPVFMYVETAKLLSIQQLPTPFIYLRVEKKTFILWKTTFQLNYSILFARFAFSIESNFER